LPQVSGHKGPLNVLGNGWPTCGVDIGHDHRRSLPGQVPGNRGADAAPSASHNRHLAIRTHVHAFTLLLVMCVATASVAAPL
jgi:hypothetical protein